MMSAWNQASHGVSTSCPPKACASSETVIFSAARLLETAPHVTPPATMKMMPEDEGQEPDDADPLGPLGHVVVVISSLPSPAAGSRTPGPDEYRSSWQKRPNTTTLARNAREWPRRRTIGLRPDQAGRARARARAYSDSAAPSTSSHPNAGGVDAVVARASVEHGPVGGKADDRVGHRVVVGHEEPVDAVLDELRDPGPAPRDDHQAGGPRLERGDPERLELGRREEDVGVGVGGANLRTGQATARARRRRRRPCASTAAAPVPARGRSR